MTVKRLIILKIINVSFLSILEIANYKETMMEIKTFVGVSIVSSQGLEGGYTYPITCKHGFCWISASPFRGVINLALLFSYMAAIQSLAGRDSCSIQYFAIHFKTLKSSCR